MIMKYSFLEIRHRSIQSDIVLDFPIDKLAKHSILIFLYCLHTHTHKRKVLTSQLDVIGTLLLGNLSYKTRGLRNCWILFVYHTEL